MKKKIPPFRYEAIEQAFWASHVLMAYVDWKTARNAAFPNLKPSAFHLAAIAAIDD